MSSREDELLDIIRDLSLEKGQIFSSFMKNRDEVMQVLHEMNHRLACELATPSELRWMVSDAERWARITNANREMPWLASHASRIGSTDVQFEVTSILSAELPGLSAELLGISFEGDTDEQS